MRSEVLKVVVVVVVVMLLVTLASRYVTLRRTCHLTLMMDVAGTLKCQCASARLHGVTTENIFGVGISMLCNLVPKHWPTETSRDL
jgi:hypothetical protein